MLCLVGLFSIRAVEARAQRQSQLIGNEIRKEICITVERSKTRRSQCKQKTSAAGEHHLK